MKSVVVLLLLCIPAQPAAKKWWLLSGALLAGSTVLDAYSSTGKYESNPLLRAPDGRYSPCRGIAIKAVVTGGGLMLEYFMTRKHRDLYGVSTTANLITSGVYVGAAVHNVRTK